MKNSDKTKIQLIDELKQLKREFDQYKINYPLAGMWQQVVDNSPVSIQVLDKDGYSVSVNKAHTKLFRAVPPPGYNVFTDALLMKQDLADSFNRLKNGEAVFFPDTWYNAHLYNPRFPNKLVWIKTCGFPILDATGKPEMLMVIHEDITKQKKLKQALEEKNSQLRGLTRHIQQRIEEERTLLSQQLHDKVLQDLAGNYLIIDSVVMRGISDELKSDLTRVSANLRNILNIIRDITGMLRPEIMEIHGIETAIDYYTNDFARINHLTIDLDVDKGLNMPADMELQVYRTLQEALNNVAKHSKAKKVGISLKKTADGYHFVIRDNGKGFAELQPSSRLQFGIIMMKERMASVGGTFSIDAIEPKGTKIEINLPKE